MDIQTIEKVAHLARLELTENETKAYADNLSNILKLVEQMSTVDTSDVEPLFHPLELSLNMRPDVVTETDKRALYQQNAPATEAGLYLVPKVIEVEE